MRSWTRSLPFLGDAPASRRVEPWTIAALLGGALAVALGVLLAPLLAAGMVVVMVLLAAGLGERTRLSRWFLVVLGVVLGGYALMGRGFAYLGAPPVFVGELVLGLGGLAAVVSGRLSRTFRSPVAWAIAAYMAWGAFRTVPYLGTHGVSALRDAVLWGYAIFAVLTAAALLRTGWMERTVSGYRRFLPWLLVLGPLGLVLSERATALLPSVPGSSVALVDVKPGDLAVHLAVAGAFLVLGLYGSDRSRSRGWLEWVWWAVWLGGFLLAATQNRGGMVAAVGALGLILLLRPSFRWFRVLVPAFVLAATLVALDVEVDLGGGREVSARQLVRNAASTVGLAGNEGLRSTVEWRKRWWGDIVEYTVFGPHFWTGKGYGVNLASADGYQVTRDESLRSPHNGHLTVLARSGVPGLLLWMALHGVFAASLLRAYGIARREGEEWWARVNLWILAGWAAFLINGTFDVFLEGPQGGIWLWSLVGFGIAAIEVQKRERDR